jgi:hypothetical protein
MFYANLKANSSPLWRHGVRDDLATAVLLLGIALTSLAPGPPRTSRPVRGPAQPCATQAYVTDRDPKGLNVRSGPGANFPAIRRLPGGVDIVVHDPISKPTLSA